MIQSNSLTLPFSSEESYRRLSQLLQSELRSYFREESRKVVSPYDSAELDLSPNGYVFFQFYNFKDMTVYYPYTDSFSFYEASEVRVAEIYKGLTGADLSESTRSAQGHVLEILKVIVWGGIGKELSAALSEGERAVFDGLMTEVSSEIDSSVSLLNCVKKSLTSLLRLMKQPLTIGLGHERFGDPATKVYTRPDILKAQNDASDSDACLYHRAIYRAIVAIEKFFFVGALTADGQERTRRSFVAFADLFCYGQRAGYMFIIESYDSDEMIAKVKCAESFLGVFKGRVESLVKEIKERSFWTKVLDDMDKANYMMSEDEFIDSVKSHIPEIINATKSGEESGVCIDTGKEIDDIEIEPDALTGMYELRLPLRLDGGSDKPKYLGTLKITVDPLDAEKDSERREGKLGWDGLRSEWNKYEVLRTISSGLALYGMNQKMQKAAEDIQWKHVGLKTLHNIKTDLGAAQKGLELYLYRQDRTEHGGAEQESIRATMSVLDSIRTRTESILFFEKKRQGTEPREDEYFSVDDMIEMVKSEVASSTLTKKIKPATRRKLHEVLTNQGYLEWVTVRGRERPLWVEETFRIGLVELLKNGIEHSDASYGVRAELDYTRDDEVLLVIKNSRPMAAQILEYVSGMKSGGKRSTVQLDVGFGLRIILDTLEFCGIAYDVTISEQGETVFTLTIPCKETDGHGSGPHNNLSR